MNSLPHTLASWQLTMHHAVTKEGCCSYHSQHGDCCQGDNYRLFVAQCARIYKQMKTL